jgi:hypothetical protein
VEKGRIRPGIYPNEASPTLPATTLAEGINLHREDIFQVQIRYDGTTLTMTVSDLTQPANTHLLRSIFRLSLAGTALS